jgi:conjugal transfer pilus assembly protein TraK
MTSLIIGSTISATGAYLLSRVLWILWRFFGAILFVVGLFVIASPAFADQNLMVADNGTVQCDASARDLTRISLKDDQFAAVSKVTSGVPSEDFSIVNEPVRGDIYVSVPEQYSRKTISFFGTTRKGFVYKFICTVAGDQAKQVFIGNADIERGPQDPAEAIPATLSTNEGAIRLVKAMYQQSIPPGFEIRPVTRAPVNVGTLKVQMISEYRGVMLTGKEMRIENKGSQPVRITDEMVVSSGAIAVSIAQPELQPGQATTAYTVFAKGDAQ